MITDTELIFWCVCGVLSILAFCAVPLIANYLEYERLHGENKIYY